MNMLFRSARLLLLLGFVPIPDFIVSLRRQVGQAQLWLPGVTAVVRRSDEILLVRRADNGEWTPVTGIVTSDAFQMRIAGTDLGTTVALQSSR